MGQLIVFLTLLALGYGFGRLAESRHYRSIIAREDALRSLLVLPDRMPPIQFQSHTSTLVTGSVVISVDYFKTVAAGLRGIFGGRVGAYESLLDRARREAILRMQEEAQSLGAEAVFNLKFETSRIGQNAGQGLGSVEVLAYGTALIPTPVSASAASAVAR
ncbi:YbjQ family protein [Thalassolituus hydrocarboniclasticus]|uniref:YbjQ family protein n=1 Tax=Thalassolituus hydrocarboniclasticus TaxID=2742796 RepID=A0ABY6AEJ3_9GAMM|nr:YbjQ family protein [Thalassolituus hydrocarboniclasticus]UXD88285.1 YbjQ family protein [Thalassolituus hydrocarboniclasticus]